MSGALLDISESSLGGKHIIGLTGDIDAKTAPLLKEAIERASAAGNHSIILDFSALNYISSAGIGVMNAALSSLKSKGGGISIAAANKAVMDTLEVMYFTKKVKVYSSAAEAAKNF